MNDTYFVASIWKKHRKMISPLFTSIALQDLVKTFAVHSNKLVENLYQVCEKKDIDMHIFIADCTMNVVLGMCRSFYKSCQWRNNNR